MSGGMNYSSQEKLFKASIVMTSVVLSLPMSELMLNNWSNVIALYSANNPQCSLLSMSDTKNYIILKLLDNV